MNTKYIIGKYEIIHPRMFYGYGGQNPYPVLHNRTNTRRNGRWMVGGGRWEMGERGGRWEVCNRDIIESSGTQTM